MGFFTKTRCCNIPVQLDISFDYQFTVLFILESSVADPDPYGFGPAGFASGSISHKCGSGSGSFNNQAKIVIKTTTLISPDLDPNVLAFGWTEVEIEHR
jgi:hypothetical protein